jgi:hypothetical protein
MPKGKSWPEASVVGVPPPMGTCMTTPEGLWFERREGAYVFATFPVESGLPLGHL